MRICLIGYGYWGKNLARVFGKDLVGICDYNQDNIDKAKEILGWTPKINVSDWIRENL